MVIVFKDLDSFQKLCCKNINIIWIFPFTFGWLKKELDNDLCAEDGFVYEKDAIAAEYERKAGASWIYNDGDFCCLITSD